MQLKFQENLRDLLWKSERQVQCSFFLVLSLLCLTRGMSTSPQEYTCVTELVKAVKLLQGKPGLRDSLKSLNISQKTILFRSEAPAIGKAGALGQLHLLAALPEEMQRCFQLEKKNNNRGWERRKRA